MNGLQLTLTFKKSMWNTPLEYKDLSDATEIAIDLGLGTMVLVKSLELVGLWVKERL
jgi:hypothetical protein